MRNQASNPQLYPFTYDDTKYTGNAPRISKYNLCSVLLPEKADSLRNIGEEEKRQRCLKHLLYARHSTGALHNFLLLMLVTSLQSG